MNFNEAKDPDPTGVVPGKPIPSTRSMTTDGVLDRARAVQHCVTSENLSSRAWRKAHDAAGEAARHERLAEMLTPEIERTLLVLQECISLGLIDVRFIREALMRGEQEGPLGRQRF